MNKLHTINAEDLQNRTYEPTHFCCPLTGVTTLAGVTRLVFQAPAGFSIGV